MQTVEVTEADLGFSIESYLQNKLAGRPPDFVYGAIENGVTDRRFNNAFPLEKGLYDVVLAKPAGKIQDKILCDGAQEIIGDYCRYILSTGGILVSSVGIAFAHMKFAIPEESGINLFAIDKVEFLPCVENQSLMAVQFYFDDYGAFDLPCGWRFGVTSLENVAQRAKNSGEDFEEKNRFLYLKKK